MKFTKTLCLKFSHMIYGFTFSCCLTHATHHNEEICQKSLYVIGKTIYKDLEEISPEDLPSHQYFPLVNDTDGIRSIPLKPNALHNEGETTTDYTPNSPGQSRKLWLKAIHGQVISKYKFANTENDIVICTSGTLIGPRHVLVSGYAVHNRTIRINGSTSVMADDIMWPTEVHFVPAGYSVDQGIKAVTLIAPKNWQKMQHGFYNLGLLVLKEPIGEQLGYAGIMSYSEDKLQQLLSLPIHVTGYPHGGIYGDFADYEAFQKNDNFLHLKIEPGKLQGISGGSLNHDRSITWSQNGGSVWINNPENLSSPSPHIIGINLYVIRPSNMKVFDKNGRLAMEPNNSALLITPEKFERIIQWLRGEYRPTPEQQALKQQAQDYKKRIKNDSNDYDAKYALAQCYEKGIGVRQDLEKAYQLYSYIYRYKIKAASFIPKVSRKIADLYFYGADIGGDYSYAKSYYKDAIAPETTDPSIFINLGIINYRLGIQSSNNLEKQQDKFKKASDYFKHALNLFYNSEDDRNKIWTLVQEIPQPENLEVMCQLMPLLQDKPPFEAVKNIIGTIQASQKANAHVI